MKLGKGRYRFRNGGKFIKLLFHGDDSVPCAKLIAAVCGKTAFYKAVFFVHPKGRRVVLLDKRIANAKALLFQQLQKPLKKQRAYSAPLCVRMNINGILHGPLIGGAGIQRAAVGIAEDYAVLLINKPRIFLIYFLDSAAKFRGGGYFIFKGIRSILYIWGINAKKLLRILRLCNADFSGQFLFFRKLSLLIKYWIAVNGSMAKSIISAAVPSGTSINSL